MTEKFAHSLNDLEERGLGCRSKLHKLIRRGDLIARKQGRRTVVLNDDLKRYLENLPVVGDGGPDR
jgi:hypothetical protein